MRVTYAFLKKELLEQARSGKLLLLSILFVLFGIMNPAVAKLTPWLLEAMADSLAAGGMQITVSSVTALDSWVQFYKNIPMALIAFVLLQCGIFTKEYRSGTLVLALTKGVARLPALLAKVAVLCGLWTGGYWLCYGITYAYNAYYWDNGIAQNLLFSAACWWLFGLWVIGLLVLFSVLLRSANGVAAGVGGVVFGSSLLGMLLKIQPYLPTRLTEGTALIYGSAESADYLIAAVIVAILTAGCWIAAIPLFNKKPL